MYAVMTIRLKLAYDDSAYAYSPRLIRAYLVYIAITTIVSTLTGLLWAWGTVDSHYGLNICHAHYEYVV